MKFLHISDLHLGRKLHEYSLIDEQKYILSQIIDIIKQNNIQSLLIAGDVYDTTQPSVDAIGLMDNFLCELAKLNIYTFVISGNHDSGQRLSYGEKFFNRSNIFLAGNYNGSLQTISLQDEFGELCVHLLSFVKPSSVYPYHEVDSYTEAVKSCLSDIDNTKRNIILSHQFVISASKKPKQCESERIMVGGLEDVDLSVYNDFDYVALGHIHSAQHIGSNNVRYCGSPLKYSISEAKDTKSATMVTISEKGTVQIELIPLIPMHDLITIKGNLDELVKNALPTDDFVYAYITDTEQVFDVSGKLGCFYPQMLGVSFTRESTSEYSHDISVDDISQHSPFDLFCDFFKTQQGRDLSDTETDFIKKIIDQASEVNPNQREAHDANGSNQREVNSL